MDDNTIINKGFFLVSAEEVSNTRGRRPPSKIMVDVLGENVNIFLSQMDGLLEKTPSNISKFQFVEFEVTAEINAKGQIVIVGTGGELGMTTGVKFVFRKLPVTNDGKQPKKSSRRKSKK